MSSKNPISFAFSILFEIAAVVAIVSVLPKINLRPSAAASQSSQALPISTTDLRVQAQQLWNDSAFASVPQRPQVSQPAIEATPIAPPSQVSPQYSAIPAHPASLSHQASPQYQSSPQYVEQQLDRASQRLLNTMGGAVNQASQEWLRPAPPQTAPVTQPFISPPQNDFRSPPVAPQTAQKPAQWPTATQSSPQARPWLRY